MKKHPTKVERFDGTVDELVSNIGKLRYDVTKEFLEKLADEYKNQATADFEKNRLQLASKLYAFSAHLYSARDTMEEIWKLCKPYMKNELDE